MILNVITAVGASAYPHALLSIVSKALPVEGGPAGLMLDHLALELELG